MTDISHVWLIPLLALGSTFGFGQTTVSGDKNQTTGTNNGVMNQYNITVNPTVKEHLQRRAKEDLGDEQGWLRVLTPANDPDIPTNCNFPKDAIAVVLGGGNVGACSKSLDVCRILTDSKSDAETSDLLSVSKRGVSLAIHAVVFGEDGKILAKLDDSKPHINVRQAFEWNRPDEHTLNVMDDRNRKVLHIRFVNMHTIYVEGLFFDSRGNSAQILKDNISFRAAHQTQSGITLTRSCSVDSKRGALAF